METRTKRSVSAADNLYSNHTWLGVSSAILKANLARARSSLAFDRVERTWAFLREATTLGHGESEISIPCVSSAASLKLLCRFLPWAGPRFTSFESQIIRVEEIRR